MSDKSEELSKQRTEWSEDRTLMSSERSFSSWVGTGLGCVGVAIGFNAVFGELSPTWLPKVVASLFLLAGLIFVWSARNRACATRDRLSENDTDTGGRLSFSLIALLLSFSIIATGVVLWKI
ncbi:DUF202 domain-containing protein [Lentibacter algarum]|uniref:YidH family protein n=1 Tax=Lentibacter algarum TaxID=576131 RepID=UPI001C06D2CA|nr:DUF202 domain-containing protein [Lentibacter algarum]MBU2981512.1 DUF202 domain-containing protein [Lentibacter algarum]